MRNVSKAVVGAAVIIALGQGLASGARAGDDGRPAGPWVPGPYRPWAGGFDVQVLVGGRALPQGTAGGERRVEAVAAAEYELRLTNPLPERVAVAVSVDGLNVLDARHTNAWDAGKWVIHPHGTLTLSGWQVGTERARRFYFTDEADSYAARLGRPADFGVIRAVFFRERRPPPVVAPRPPGGGAAPREARDVSEAYPLTAPAGDAGAWRRGERPRYEPGRAATGIGRSKRSEVDVVEMALEREPVAEVEVRYAYRPPWQRPGVVPRPGTAPEVPSRRGPSTGPEDRRFCPEP